MKNDIGLISKYRTAIMGVASLWIFLFHEWSPIMEGHWKCYAVETFLKTIGFCGVDIFLFLSGMGLIYAIKKHNVLTFYKRRLIKVFVPFLIIAIVMMLVNGWEMETFLKNVTGYNFYTVSIYSFLWFGPAIMTLYILFPLYYFLFNKSASKYQFTVAVLVIWLFFSLMVCGIMRGDLYGFTNRIPVFVIGVLAGWIVQEKEVHFTGFTWLLCCMILAMGLYLSYKVIYEDMYLVVPISDCCIPNLLIATSGSCLLAKIFSVLDVYGRLVGRVILKFLNFFGIISMEFYCVQEWMGTIVSAKMAGRYSDLCINLVILICVTVGALLLFGVCKLIRMVTRFDR